MELKKKAQNEKTETLNNKVLEIQNMKNLTNKITTVSSRKSTEYMEE